MRDARELDRLGDIPPGAALIVARGFAPEDSLQQICSDFLTETLPPLTLLEVGTLLLAVDVLRDDPSLRTRIRWRHLLGGIGLLSAARWQEEFRSATTESWRRELREP